MKHTILFFTIALLFAACGENVTEAEYRAADAVSVNDNTVALQNGKSYELPHAGDSEYRTLVLVRHAEKAKEAGDNPNLSEEGFARAEKLKDILLPLSPDRCYVTSYKRSVLTSMPLAKAIKRPNMHYKPEDYYTLFDLIFKEHNTQKSVIVGHSNTIPEMLNLLVGEKRYDDLAEDAYSRMFVVRSKGLGESEVTELKF